MTGALRSTAAKLGRQGYTALLRLTDWAAYVVLASMAVIVCIDVFCRYIFGFSTQIAEEAASLGLVALMFVALPGAFSDNAFLRVDALYNHVRGRLKSALDLVFHLIALAAATIYMVSVARLATASYFRGLRSDSLLATPNVLPQAVMVFGLAALLVVIVVGLLRCVGDVLRTKDDDA